MLDRFWLSHVRFGDGDESGGGDRTMTCAALVRLCRGLVISNSPRTPTSEHNGWAHISKIREAQRDAILQVLTSRTWIFTMLMYKNSPSTSSVLLLQQAYSSTSEMGPNPWILAFFGCNKNPLLKYNDQEIILAYLIVYLLVLLFIATCPQPDTRRTSETAPRTNQHIPWYAFPMPLFTMVPWTRS